MMNYKTINGLVEGVIESEFGNVQEFREFKFSQIDLSQKELDKEVLMMWDKIKSNLSIEQQDLVDKLETVLANKWTNICRFYFREGVGAGLTNLKFLNNIEGVGSYIR